MNVLATERIPIKMWTKSRFEEGAIKQAKNLANLPFAFKHIALMPDTHEGYGMPIGGVLATENVFVPNAVGVDIGCGMCAVKTNFQDITTKALKEIMGEVRKAIPIGFAKNERPVDIRLMPEWESVYDADIVRREYEKSRFQLGTLGGGNHFLEFQKDAGGYLWVMIHSGSRNLGLQIANHYNQLAISLNRKWHSNIPESWQLAFLPVDSDEGQQYFAEMEYAVKFALANRKLMMDVVFDVMTSLGFEFGCEPIINIAHNYAAFENHFGKNVWVHRKGATLAREGTIGIIPSSQGTKSYIVRGKGNPDSFNSCSHGAGRRMGRKEAQRTLDLAEEQRKLDSKGILHAIRGQADLDEAAGAYKDIDEVMANQTDLVEILEELTPLGVIKG